MYIDSNVAVSTSCTLYMKIEGTGNLFWGMCLFWHFELCVLIEPSFSMLTTNVTVLSILICIIFGVLGPVEMDVVQ